MSPADLVLAAWQDGLPLRVVRGRVVGPRSLDREIARVHDELVELLTTPPGALVLAMTAAQREDYGERAAILEFDGGFPREIADQAAAWWALHRRD